MKRFNTQRPSHRPFRPASTPRRAFTLVEVLVGIMISSMIITSAFAAYMTAISSWKKSRQASNYYQHARVALTLMERYLRAALPPGQETNIVFEGENSLELELFDAAGTTPASEDADGSLESDTLRFSTTGGPIVAGHRKVGDICEVQFYLSAPPEGTAPSLMMQKSVLPTDEASWFEDEDVETMDEAYANPPAELAPNVISFDVMYFDGYEWVDEWITESSSSLPRAVQITLVFAAPSQGKKIVQFAKLIVLNTSSGETEQDWSTLQT